MDMTQKTFNIKYEDQEDAYLSDSNYNQSFLINEPKTKDFIINSKQSYNQNDLVTILNNEENITKIN